MRSMLVFLKEDDFINRDEDMTHLVLSILKVCRHTLVAMRSPSYMYIPIVQNCVDYCKLIIPLSFNVRHQRN